MKRGWLERNALIGLLGLGAVSALGGAYGLLSGTLGMERSVLDGSPFASFTVPALILGAIVGGSQLAALGGLVRRAGWSIVGAGAAGGIMVGWIASEVLLIGSDPGVTRNLQLAYLLVGLGEATLAALLLRDSHRRTRAT
jgi:hypothetical protein